MATTLPTLTRTLDDVFTENWYEIRPEAQDNILDAIVVWAALREAGCFVTQSGSDWITRTVRYGETNPTSVQKGDILPQGEPDLETMAMWSWRFEASHVQRNIFDDRANSGPTMIKPYIKKRFNAARDGFLQKFETNILRTEVTDESGRYLQGLNDIVPAYANSRTGTYGRLARPSAYSEIAAANGVYAPTASGTNPWWGPKYKQITLPTAVNLISDMKVLYNSIHNNQEPPNLIISDQALYETYEEFAQDISQVIKDENTRLADLGFQVLRFKGKTMIWSPNMTAGDMLFLNTDYIDVVYDPGMWFDATEWKPIALQGTRIMHILCAVTAISDQLRRHGRLTSQTVS